MEASVSKASVHKRRALLAMLLALPAYPSLAAKASRPLRIVTLGGGVTEIVYALGAGDSVVGVDISSIYPQAANQLPKIGYYRDVSVEGITALRPDLVLASEQSGPSSALQRLQQLGLPVHIVSDAPTLPSLYARIERVAGSLHREQQGKVLQGHIQQQLASMAPAITDKKPRVLSLMAHTDALLMAGKGTAADAMMSLAGFENVMQSQQGYKPVSAEAVAAMAPDLLITTELTVKAQGGLAAMLAKPALASTPAVKAGRVIVLDDQLYLTFGPRLPQAVAQMQDGWKKA